MFDRVISPLIAFSLRQLAQLMRRRGLDGLALQCLVHARGFDLTSVSSLYAEARRHWNEDNHDAARVLLKRLLDLDPDHARASNLLGAIHFAADEFAAAEACFLLAIRLEPGLADAHNNLGNIFTEREDFRTAETHYLAALRCDPQCANAISNLGMILNRQGRFVEAEKKCREALQLQPRFAGALNNLATALLGQERRGDAIEHYRAALQLQGDLPEARLNLALILSRPEQLLGALDQFRRAFDRNPNSYLANLRLGMALKVAGDWSGSEYHLEIAGQLNPTSADVPSLRGENASLSANYLLADDRFTRALLLGAGAALHSTRLFHRLYDPGLTPLDLFREAREWAVLNADYKLPTQFPWEIVGLRGEIGRRLRIGYVSKDFAVHSVSYFVEPVIASHDRDGFEIFCYSNNPAPDDVTRKFEVLAEHWRDIAFLTDDAAFEMIRSDRIDILVDLSGHTTGDRLQLFARKPAPVQISYLGYPASVGMAAIDYRIVDAITDPVGNADELSRESLIRLPGCFLTYRPREDAPPIVRPPVEEGGHITFASFNNPLKINRDVASAWSRILAAVPTSRLILKGSSFAISEAVIRFREMFTSFGVAADRLDFIAWHPEVKGHLEMYNRIDIALDPFPYNGTTTTCEALWMGVPVIVLAGNHHSSRVGASLLTAVGLDQFVGTTVDAYVDSAVQLASDLALLAAIRAGLRERMRSSILLDACGFTRNLETAYKDIWRTFLNRPCVVADAPLQANSARVCAIRLPGNERIYLPDSLDVMTRYVVEEQGEGFQDEVRFICDLVEPGMNVIDIGANYGVYSLSLGTRVGGTGKVWALESSPEVAKTLRLSCAENALAQVEVIETAVTPNREHRRSIEHAPPESQRVAPPNNEGACDGHDAAAWSLDALSSAHDWRSISFVRIAAEHSDGHMVRGGEFFFTAHSPLVMVKSTNGLDCDSEKICEFKRLGYDLWRHVPGLHLLVSAKDDGALLTTSPLHLYFCKPDRASKLAAADRLVIASARIDEGLTNVGGRALSLFSSLTYSRRWREGWKKWKHDHANNAAASEAATYLTVLEHYACYRDETNSRITRWLHLERAIAMLSAAIDGDTRIERRLTYIRMLYDAGLLALASSSLSAIMPHLLAGALDLVEPFLPLSARFEHLEPVGQVSNWLLAATLEQHETKNAVTGYLNPVDSLRRLRDIRLCGYADSNIARRTNLIIRRCDERLANSSKTPH